MSQCANAFICPVVKTGAVTIAVLTMLFAGSEAEAALFSVTNLVTNDQNVNSAQITDSHLKNAWGISYGPDTAFSVSANGSGLALMYAVDPVTNATTKLGLEVTIPGDGSVTGQAFSGGAGFNGDSFLFVSEDGTISGWRPALGTNAERFQVADPANVYKGTTLETIGGHEYLLSANFQSGNIDVLKGDTSAPGLTGNFTDPGLPAGYAPFDIQLLGGRLYVTYALQNGKDDAPGAGHGIVTSFDLQGNFLGRIGTMGTLNSPWGLAIAPSSFGDFAGDLLVGNFGDGRINVFNSDPTTPAFLGQLNGPDGNPLEIDGLWGLIVGNGVQAGSAQALYFSAGPNDEANGLFGVIAPVPEPSTLVLSSIVLGIFGIVGLRNRTTTAARTSVIVDAAASSFCDRPVCCRTRS